jgi:catalase (peroxidase I)
MVFKMGREDISGEPNVVKHEKETIFNSYNVAQLSKLNLAPEDYVALIGGCHTIGFHSLDTKGAQSRWTMNPMIFDNSYF